MAVELSSTLPDCYTFHIAGFSELAPHVPPTKVEYLHKAMDTDLNVCVVGNNGFRCPY